MPSVLSVGSSQSLFHLVRLSRCEGSLPHACRQRLTIRMNSRRRGRAACGFLRYPGKTLPGPVDEVALAVWPIACDQCRDRIEREPKLLFGTGQLGLIAPQRILRALPVFDVVGRRIPGDHLSVVIAQRREPCSEPAVLAVGSSEPLFRLERFACRQCGIPRLFDLLDIVGVGYDAGAPRPVRRCDSAVAAPDLIDEINDAVGAMAKEQYGHRVDDQL